VTALPAAARTPPPPPPCPALSASRPLPHVPAGARAPEAAGTGEGPCTCHEPAVFGHLGCPRGGFRQGVPRSQAAQARLDIARARAELRAAGGAP
jgi:hypothetical protein